MFVFGEVIRFIDLVRLITAINSSSAVSSAVLWYWLPTADISLLWVSEISPCLSHSSSQLTFRLNLSPPLKKSVSSQTKLCQINLTAYNSLAWIARKHHSLFLCCCRHDCYSKYLITQHLLVIYLLHSGLLPNTRCICYSIILT